MKQSVLNGLSLDDIVLTNEVPSARDAQGNPYVGAGDSGGVTPPPPVHAPAPPALEAK